MGSGGRATAGPLLATTSTPLVKDRTTQHAVTTRLRARLLPWACVGDPVAPVLSSRFVRSRGNGFARGKCETTVGPLQRVMLSCAHDSNRRGPQFPAFPLRQECRGQTR